MMPTMPLALFDLDNTLVDRTSAFRRSAALLAAAYGLDPAEAVPFIVEVDDDGRALWEDWFPLMKERFGLAPGVDELMAAHRPRYVGEYVVDDATAAALARLRAARWRIGIVTNGPATQEDKIRATGLDELVDGWAVSDLVGARKPAPAIFAAAADACGATLEGAWMVGDSAPADIAGAHRAGLRSIWLPRGRRWGDVAFVPDAFAARVGDAEPDLPPDFAPGAEAEDIPQAVDLILAGAAPAP